MPLKELKTPLFKSPRQSEVSWSNFRKGLNTLLRESEIGGDELTQATNLMLIGSGVPTKRWGSDNYFLANATGSGRGVFPIKKSDGTIEVLALTDWGILTKKNNASYTNITGASFASGYNMEAVQLADKVYLVNGQREMVRYDFDTLLGFPTLAIPTGLAVTNLSGATGLRTQSWIITAISRVGETIGSTAKSHASLPQTLSDTTIRVNWTPISAASGDLTGYGVYRGNPGDEVFVGGVDNETTRFDDTGVLSPDPTRTPPLADTTGGPIAEYTIRYQDRILLAGVAGQLTRLLISGRYPWHERFDVYSGGGFIDIEPDSGDIITGLATFYQSSTNTQTIIVFKENSVWEVRLSTFTLGDMTILDPTYRLLTHSQGCSSHRSIAYVESDIMFGNRKGLYALRYEPTLINVISAAELSAKIRPFFETLSNADLTSATAIYIDKKYIISYPASKKTMTFDRERLSFMGPWETPFGINQWASYVDSDGLDQWITSDADDNYISVFKKTYSTDKDTAINTILKTKKEDFKDWTVFKTINEIYTLFRNVLGSLNVNIYLEERSGQTVTAKSFTITSATGTSGFGTDLFGLTQFGLSNSDAEVSSEELPKNTLLYKSARTFQIEIQTTGKSDSYELLAVKAIGIPQPRSAPVVWRTS